MRCCVFAVSAISLVLACAGPAAGQDLATIAIEHVNVVTMANSSVLRDQTVLVADGLVTAVSPSGTVTVPDNALPVDGTGRFLIPGLAGTHVHILDVNDFPLLLAHGVTTVPNMSGSEMVLDWREQVEAGSLLGPTLYTTGPQIKPEPHPLVDIVVGLSDPADAERVVGDQVAAGYDLIRVWGDHEYESLAAVLRASDLSGIRVTGHLSDRVGLGGAVTLGESSVAHIEEIINGDFNRQLDEGRIPIAVREAQRGDLAIGTTLATYDMIARATSSQDDDAFIER